MRIHKVLNLSCVVPKIVLLVFILVTLIACSSDSESISGETANRELNFTVLHTGDGIAQEGAVMEYITLNDQSAYAAQLARYSNDQPQDIDFSTQRVLLVAMGMKPSGGFSISVTRVEEFSDRVVATVSLDSPGSGCVLTQALTYPYEIVRIPAVVDKIQIDERSTTTDCG